MKIGLLPAVALTGLLVLSACLAAGDPSGPVPALSETLEVQVGYTPGELLEGTEKVFSLAWNAASEAAYYEIRISPSPVDADNWDEALLVSTVEADTSAVMAVNVTVQPEVFSNTCIGCGLCETVCPHDAITLVDGRAVIDLDLCTSCGQCVMVCPVQAISDSRFGQPYHFAVRAFGPGGAGSTVISTPDRYYLRYANDPSWCGDCAEACYILLDTCGPGCPVDAVWFDSTGFIHIDYELCIHCGQCQIQCQGYGLWSLKREVVQE